MSRAPIRTVAITALLIFLVFGLSFVGTGPDRYGPLSVNHGGSNQAFAAETDWSGVRNVATLARSTTLYFNTFYTIIQQLGLVFNFTISITVPIPERGWTVKVKTNSPYAASSTIDGPVTYQHRIQITAGGTTAFQLFFDSPNGSGIGNGSLIKIKPYYFDKSNFTNTAILEGRVKPVGSDIALYVTVSGDPWKTNPPTWVHSGRVKMLHTQSLYHITALAWAGVDGTTGHTTCTGTAGDGFYTLAYIAKGASPNYSTSLWGWDDSVRSNQLCGIPNPKNYGYYKSTSPHFQSDGNTADDGVHPAIADVDALYAGMATAEFAEAAIKNPGITLTAW